MELVRSLRYHGKHAEAWAIYQTIDFQSEEANTEHAKAFLAYERSILNYYVGTPKGDALVDFMISYSLYKNIDYNNMQFYVGPFPSTIRKFPMEARDDFLPTSTSILRLSPTKLLLNVRYVNYRIQANGSYLMLEDGKVSPHYYIRSRNICLITNNDFEILEEKQMLAVVPPYQQRNICGMEDIRLFRKNYSICFSATTCEYSHNGLIQEIQGTYDIDTQLLTDLEPMHSPTNAAVEKNWIPINRAFGDSLYIYSWHPMVIGSVKGGIFTKEKELPTPYFFRSVRGSSTFVYNECHDDKQGYLYAMVHCVIETVPRKYYHILVKLALTLDLVAYTVPYYFVQNSIEYTLGIDIVGSKLKCIASQNDCNPIIVEMDMGDLRWITV